MAQDINSVTLVGNLTRDCEVAFMNNNMAVGKLSLASNRSKKQADGTWGNEVSYFDAVIFGKQAENLGKYLTKGKKVGIVGSLKQDRWEKDGQKFTRVRIIADSVQLLGGNGESHQNNSNNQNYNQQSPHPQQNQQSFQDNSYPEDIPF